MKSTWTIAWRGDPAETFGGDFGAEWRAAYARDESAHPFQNPDWLQAWWETVGKATDVQLAVAEAHGPNGARIVFPACVATTAGKFVHRRALAPLGDSFCCYTDPLALEGDPSAQDWKAFWSAFERSLAPLADQALVRFVHPSHAPTGGAEPAGDANPVLDLSDKRNLDDLLAPCSANHRGDIRRRLRRGADFGGFELWTPGVDELPAVLEDFRARLLPAYARLWDSRPQGNLLDKLGTADFVERCLRIGLPAGWCHYSALRIAGQSAAWHIGLQRDAEMYWWIPAHDPQCDASAPGKVQLTLLLEHCLGRNMKRFHFLTGGHAYKLAWKPTSQSLTTVRQYARTWKGRLLDWYDRRRRGAQIVEATS